MNFKTICLALLINACLPGAVVAQMPNPVKWSHTVEYGKGDEVTLVFIADIEKGWHLYSQDLPEGGPIKTTFTIAPSESFKADGAVAEGKATEFYDKNFEMQLKYFSGQAKFTQKIHVKSAEPFQIPANVEFMVCDDLKCLPPVVVEFKIDVKGLSASK